VILHLLARPVRLAVDVNGHARKADGSIARSNPRLAPVCGARGSGTASKTAFDADPRACARCKASR
jgi:hypothetical protein